VHAIYLLHRGTHGTDSLFTQAFVAYFSSVYLYKWRLIQHALLIHCISPHREEEPNKGIADMMTPPVIATSLTTYHATRPHHRHDLQTRTSSNNTGRDKSGLPS
jgi:hypothetical protein